MIRLSLSDMGYKNKELLEIMHSYVLKSQDKLTVYLLSLIINSYATLVPEKMNFFSELAETLHLRLHEGIMLQ